MLLRKKPQRTLLFLSSNPRVWHISSASTALKQKIFSKNGSGLRARERAPVNAAIAVCVCGGVRKEFRLPNQTSKIRQNFLVRMQGSESMDGPESIPPNTQICNVSVCSSGQWQRPTRFFPPGFVQQRHAGRRTPGEISSACCGRG